MPTAGDVTKNSQAIIGLSQKDFATLKGVSLGTLSNWEQRRREPQGSAKSLLLIAEKRQKLF